MQDVTTLLGGLTFPESPRWRDDRLYFSDIYASEVIKVDLEGSYEIVAAMSMPSGIGWTPDGEMLVVSMDMPPQLWRVADGATMVSTDLSDVAQWPCNDMVIDGQGSVYVGQLGFAIPPDDAGDDQTDPPQEAPLVLVRPDGPRTASHELLACGNGMAITGDGQTLIVAETFASKITAFSIATDGSLADRRLFAQLDDMPDGLCLDDEGAVWAAVLQTGRFIRVVEGGGVTDEIVLPEGRKAIACVLGGADRKTLFLCTTGSLAKQEVLSQRDGRIEMTSVEVAGEGIP
jgi:sugar lactone lactonase YvrE